MGKIGRKTQVLSPHFLYQANCEFCGSIRRWCKRSKPLGHGFPAHRENSPHCSVFARIPLSSASSTRQSRFNVQHNWQFEPNGKTTVIPAKAGMTGFEEMTGCRKADSAKALWTGMRIPIPGGCPKEQLY